MYPATSTLLLSSCTYVMMSINPNQKTTATFSVQQYLIQTNQPKRNRGKENILYLRHVVLDFENGELQPETLPKLFPDLQMVVTNTFNHTSDKPRFRAVLFTDEPMTVKAYSLIYNFVADKLEEAGYSVKRTGKKLKASKASNSRPSGLDWGRSDPTSIFYFPCQARCADDSFFIEKIEGRYPLNPSTAMKMLP